MRKYSDIRSFMPLWFDHVRAANRAAEIGQPILAARSIRLTGVAGQRLGRRDAGYKRIQRFLHQH